MTVSVLQIAAVVGFAVACLSGLALIGASKEIAAREDEIRTLWEELRKAQERSNSLAISEAAAKKREKAMNEWADRMEESLWQKPEPPF